MSQHAPRGPIKSRAPHGATDPMEVPRCTATNRRGTRCQKEPILGGTVCRMHGGSAPQVIRAAEDRLAEMEVSALDYLDWLLKQKTYPSAGLGAAKDVLDRKRGKAKETVDMNHTGSVDIAVILRQRFDKHRVSR